MCYLSKMNVFFLGEEILEKINPIDSAINCFEHLLYFLKDMDFHLSSQGGHTTNGLKNKHLFNSR